LTGTPSPSIFGFTLKLDLEHLGTAPTERHLVLPRSEHLALFEELKLDQDLTADLMIYSISDGTYRLEGTLQGSQLLTCVRSLESFSRPFSMEMTVEVKKDQVIREQVMEDEDEELYVFRIPVLQESVDLTECIRELVVLQEPMNPVKDPSQEFSWTDPATTTSNEVESADPRWEKLKEWKQKLDKPQ